MRHISITPKIRILTLLFIGISLCIPSQIKAFCVSGACFQDLQLKGMPSGGDYVPPPVPSGPSPEELREQREEEDLREAADDANDKAVEFAKNGDWETAIKYLEEALEYEPDDELIKNNLLKVREYANQAREAEAKRIHDEAERNKYNDPNVVDLHHLDPDRPVYIDPNVVKGRERQISAQASMETLNNASYNSGFEAIMNDNPILAVAYFKRALEERPGDLMVRNALLLAEDLVKVRQEKAKDAVYRKALEEAGKGISEWILNNDPETALAYLMRAQGINPSDKGIREAAQTADNFVREKNKKISPPSSEEKELEKRALKVAGGSIESIRQGDYETAVKILTDALTIKPDDIGILNTLNYVGGLAAGKKEAEKIMNKQ